MKTLTPNLIKIARYLSDGQYHSGDALGAALGITRSAVWKAIKKLAQYGVPVDSIKGKGYALTEPLFLLDKHKINKLAHHPGLDIKVFASLASTNDYLQTHTEPKRKIKICLAETQTQGRGRLHRFWYSPFGKNIYFSCRYSFQKDLSELAGLSLVTGLAIFKTMRDFGIHSELFVQWPNHIVWRQKKLAGSLIDLTAEANGGCDAIIGIGINVNLLQANVNFAWTSMREAVGQCLDRNEICAVLIKHLLNYLAEFTQQGFTAFKKEWLAHDYLMKQYISLHSQQQDIQGRMIGINDQGHLLLQTTDQRIQTFATGDSKII